MPDTRPLLVVEDDPFLRLIQVVLDPDTSAERCAAFADFMAHDEPDFAGWCARLRERSGGLYPAEVRLVESAAELRANAAGGVALVVESLPVDAATLDAAASLRAVQKYGVVLRNIDTHACAARGVKVLSLRRRANIACAEQAFAMMLALTRKIPQLSGRIGVAALAAAGYPMRPFDRRHTAGGNFGRVPGMRMLHGATLGIIGMGEIGREIAQRANAFGMRVLYNQRTRLAAAEEAAFDVSYASLDDLLRESDWVVPQVPGGAATRNLLAAEQLDRMKAGACIVNVSNAHLVDREALLAALRSGHLGGFALDPLYQEPGRDDDELLRFDNVIMVPHMAGSPRQNGLQDCEDMIVDLAREITP